LAAKRRYNANRTPPIPVKASALGSGTAPVENEMSSIVKSPSGDENVNCSV